MDPNATLEELRQYAAEILDPSTSVDWAGVERFAELVTALDEWMSKGGFMPAVWVSMGARSAFQRAARLERLIEELAEDCDQRADADMQGDPPRYVPNFAMELLTKIRAVVPR